MEFVAGGQGLEIDIRFAVLDVAEKMLNIILTNQLEEILSEIDIALKTYRFEMVYFNNSNEIYNNMENTT